MQSRHPIFIRRENCGNRRKSPQTICNSNDFRELGLFGRVQHRARLPPAAQMRFDIRPALATLKPRPASPLNAGRSFRAFSSSGFNSLCIDIVTNTMDHTFSIRECERLSITVRMIVSRGRRSFTAAASARRRPCGYIHHSNRRAHT
jgi:hypothetical protein